MSMAENRDMDKVLEAVNKVVGGGKVVLASDYLEEIPRIPTGVLGIDLATGGGIPRGRISIIAGNESSCKSALCYNLIANAQRLGDVAALIDIEQGLTPSWAKVFGIDLDKLIVSYPTTLEEAYNIADALVNMVKPGLLVIDSLAAQSPEEELEKSFEEGERRAERAKLTNRFMRVMGANLKPSVGDDGEMRPAHTAVVCIQHLYHDPSTPYFVEYTPGGRGQLFWSSLTIYMKRRGWCVEEIVTENEEGGEDLKDKRTVGLDVHWRIPKSKVSPAEQQGEFSFFIDNTLDGRFYQGQILETEHLIAIGRMWGIIAKKGAWYTFNLGGEKYKVCGVDKVTELLAEHGNEFVREVLERMREESEKARPKIGRPMLPVGEVDEMDGEEKPPAEAGEAGGEEGGEEDGREADA